MEMLTQIVGVFAKKTVTVASTEASVAGIASAKNSGQFFKLHKGMHFTRDDVFKARGLEERRAEVEELQEEKKNQLWCSVLQ